MTQLSRRSVLALGAAAASAAALRPIMPALDAVAEVSNVCQGSAAIEITSSLDLDRVLGHLVFLTRDGCLYRSLGNRAFASVGPVAVKDVFVP